MQKSERCSANTTGVRYVHVGEEKSCHEDGEEHFQELSPFFPASGEFIPDLIT